MLRARTTSASFSSCSDQLADADHGGAGERGGRRDLQALERLLPLLPRDGAGAERVEIVGQQDRRRFREPEDAAFTRHVLEGHDEHARHLQRLRLSVNGEHGENGNGEDGDNG
jgi:hypothetical protein